MLALTGTAPAEAADARLEEAQQRRAAVEQRLGEVLGRLDRLQAETAQIQDRVTQLKAEADKQQDAARAADRMLAARIADAYKRGQIPLALTLFNSDGGAAEAQDRARLLTVLASRDRATSESASSAQIRALATAEQVGSAVKELKAKEAELAAVSEDVESALAAARAEEVDIERTIAAEEQAAAERAARQRATRERETATASGTTAGTPADTESTSSSSGDAGGGGGSSGAVSGGIACPVGSPRTYSDTYGAPRSGGRSHEGTDILAPHGTPSYAYEAGTVTRMDGNSLGGITLYLAGNSGNTYYYAHLSGYASGVSPGDSVAAGDLLAYVGDSGNAAGIPHVHFEVWPGGGGGVNPYPYVLRACG